MPGSLTVVYSSENGCNSVALAIRSLKSFFRWMHQAHYISDNPTLAVNAPSEPEPESKELTNL